MSTARPATVTVAFLLVVVQIVIMLVATITAAVSPADYKTYAATTPGILIVLFAAVAYFLWAGRPWARTVAILVAAIGVIGDLSVILYYRDTPSVAVHVVGLLIALGILVLLLLPASKQYFERSR
jgi:hypothetical protein